MNTEILNQATSKIEGKTAHDVRFDDPTRRWFLTLDDFATFKDDPVAQGYEILSRHPNFPRIQVGNGRGKSRIFWNQANKHLPRITWQELNEAARSAFLVKHRFDLHRMGLLKVACVGKKAITFNCTDGVTSIQATVHYLLERAGLFKRASKDRRDRMRADPKWFKWSFNRTNPDMVTLDWSKLVKQCKEDRTSRFSDDIVAAIRTFLEHNLQYRQHRESRLAELRKRRPPRHLKKTAPEIIVAACIAADWIFAGHNLHSLKTGISPKLKEIGMSGHSDKWTNDLRALKKLQERGGFKAQKISKATCETIDDPINVAKILYPSFQAVI